ncbi:MAG: PQQ-dependent sugar dehydrogenase [Verrucomicrobiota bacterium]
MIQALTAVLVSLFVLWSRPAFSQPVDSNFARDVIYSGNGATKVAFLPSGRLLLAEKRGRVLVFEPDGNGGFRSPTEFLDIRSKVRPWNECGLLGMAVSPQFATNRHLFLFYSTDSDQRLVRYTVNSSGTGVENGSEWVVLSGLPKASDIHKAGDIAIHPLDPNAVFIVLGDDSNRDRPEQLDFFEGKILRVDAATGVGLADNPWFDGNVHSVRSRVWARGFRNPFRFTLHPTRADVVFVSENGDSTDRIARVSPGSNGRWNSGGDGAGFLSSSEGFQILATTEPSTIGIAVTTSGPFAYEGRPTLYVGNWWPNNYGIWRYELGGTDLSQATPITPPDQSLPVWEANQVAVDLEFGPDGNLYFCETGGDESLGGWYKLSRHRYAVGTPPVAGFTANGQGSASGEAPLTVQFTDTTSAGSNPIVSRVWNFGDGGNSTTQNPSRTYTSPGVYTASLVVTDSAGLSSSANATITVTKTTPVTLRFSIRDGSSGTAAPTTNSARVVLRQIGSGAALRFNGGIGVDGNGLDVPAGGNLVTTLQLPLTGSGMEMVIGQNSPGGLHAASRGFTLQPGQAADLNIQTILSTMAVRGRVLLPRGAPATVDIGVTRDSQPLAFAGGRDFLTGSGFSSTGVAHRTVSDAFGYYYIPVPAAVGSAGLSLRTTRDTGRQEFTSVAVQTLVSSGSATDRDIVIGRWSAGSGDDLSGIAPQSGIAFSRVQEIFTASCTGCHRAEATNSGGLDLMAGQGFAALVGRPSQFVPGLLLVQPGDPSRSQLFQKVNSPVPQQGSRMRPDSAMSLADQAVIRDWISALGTGSRVVFPENPGHCHPFPVTYLAGGGPLQGAGAVVMEVSWNGGALWEAHPMESTVDDIWNVVLQISGKPTQALVRFRNASLSVTDDQGWSVAIRDCDAGPVWTAPSPPITGQSVTVYYDPAGRGLPGTSSVNIHHGYNGSNWTAVPGVPMTASGGLWTYSYTVPQGATTLAMVFNHQGQNPWDNNGGQNWNFAVSQAPSTPPAAPLGLSAAATSSTTISLSWSASANATGYTVLRNGIPIASPTALAFVDSGLLPETTYSYVVRATNSAGTSGNSTSASAKTLFTPVAPESIVVLDPASQIEVAGSNHTFRGRAGGNFTAGLVWLNTTSGQNGTISFPGGSVANGWEWTANIPLAEGANAITIRGALPSAGNQTFTDSPMNYTSFGTGQGAVSGFGSWALDLTGAAGVFLAENAGNMNLGTAKGFGLWANSGGRSSISRDFTSPMRSGDSFQVKFDNNAIDNGGEVGLELRSANGTARFRFFFIGGEGNYRIADAQGIRGTSIGYTDGGLDLSLVLGAGNSYSFQAGGTTVTGNLAAGDAIARMEFFNNNAGSESPRNFYIGSMTHVVASGSQTVTANATIIRQSSNSSTDGISDAWWSQYGISGNNRLANVDPDGDGFTNAQEFALGTSPVDAGSAFRVVSIARSGSQVSVEWDSVAGKSYRLESTTDLTNPDWQPVGDVAVKAAGARSSQSATISGERLFLRVRLVP